MIILHQLLENMKALISNLISWLKTSFGKNDEVSSRRVTAFWYTVLVTIDVITTLVLCFLVIMKKLEGSVLVFDTLTTILIILVSATATLLGITTIQNISEINKNKKNEKLDIQITNNSTKSGDVNNLE